MDWGPPKHGPHHSLWVFCPGFRDLRKGRSFFAKPFQALASSGMSSMNTLHRWLPQGLCCGCKSWFYLPAPPNELSLILTCGHTVCYFFAALIPAAAAPTVAGPRGAMVISCLEELKSLTDHLLHLVRPGVEALLEDLCCNSEGQKNRRFVLICTPHLFSRPFDHCHS
jgi:hypothetical protein